MKTLMIYMLETLVCSGVLLSVYTILFERRVRFRWCRTYLLAATLFAGLIPLLRIPVWPGPVITAAPAVSGDEWELTSQIIGASPASITPAIVGSVVYVLGAALILGLMCGQMVRIRRLRRDANIVQTGSYSLVRTRKKIASFSFIRSIYVWEGVSERELAAITAHEMSHIAHRHSFERIAMECFKAAMWWNPFAWIAARRLTEVEEFEADHDVLRCGFDIETYMNVLFKQLFGYSPDIANGLRDSLTKKRFQMMTTKTTSRYGLLRLAGTVPAVLALVCAFSFTTKAAIILPAESAPGSSVQVETNAESIPPKSVAKEQPKATKSNSPTRNSSGGQKAEVTTEEIIEMIELTEKPMAADVFVRAEVMPKFRGGDLMAFREWVEAQIKYPAEAAKNATSGRVVLSFIIEKDGSMSNIEILISPDASFTKEVNRIFGTVPAGAWTPGKQRGQNVRIVYTLPVDFLAPAAVAAAQQSGSKEENVFIRAEVMPTFQGGDLGAFRTWVHTQMKYPAEAAENGISGHVTLSFIIEKDGSISGIKILQSPDESLSKEVRRIFATVPAGAWTPGKQRGQNVRVSYTLPVNFRSPTAQ